MPLRIRKRVGREIAVGDPLDALRQLAVRLHELFHRRPGFRKRNEQANRQRGIVQAANEYAQAAHAAFRAKGLAMPAAPFRVNKQDSKLGIAPHHQVGVDPPFVCRQMISRFKSFDPEARAIIATRIGPFLSGRRQEIALQRLGIGPEVPQRLSKSIHFLIDPPQTTTNLVA